MNEEKCPYCKGTERYIKTMRVGATIFCRNCHNKIGNVRSHTQVKEIIKEMKEYEKSLGEEGKAFKVTTKYSTGSVRIRCSNCRCLLFDSEYPEQGAQVKLINANYCPMCGKEFVELNNIR